MDFSCNFVIGDEEKLSLAMLPNFMSKNEEDVGEIDYTYFVSIEIEDFRNLVKEFKNEDEGKMYNSYIMNRCVIKVLKFVEIYIARNFVQRKFKKLFFLFLFIFFFKQRLVI